MMNNKAYILESLELLRESMRDKLPSSLDDELIRLFSDLTQSVEEDYDSKVKCLTELGVHESTGIVSICPKLNQDFKHDELIEDIVNELSSTLARYVSKIRNLITPTSTLSDPRVLKINKNLAETESFRSMYSGSHYDGEKIIAIMFRMEKNYFIANEYDVENDMSRVEHRVEFSKGAANACFEHVLGSIIRILFVARVCPDTWTLLVIVRDNSSELMLVKISNGRVQTLSKMVVDRNNRYLYSHQHRRLCWVNGAHYTIVDVGDSELRLVCSHPFKLSTGFHLASMSLDGTRIVLLMGDHFCNGRNDHVVIMQGPEVVETVYLFAGYTCQRTLAVADGDVLYVTSNSIIYTLIRGVQYGEPYDTKFNIHKMYLTKKYLVCEDSDVLQILILSTCSLLRSRNI